MANEGSDLRPGLHDQPVTRRVDASLARLDETLRSVAALDRHQARQALARLIYEHEADPGSGISERHAVSAERPSPACAVDCGSPLRHGRGAPNCKAQPNRFDRSRLKACALLAPRQECQSLCLDRFSIYDRLLEAGMAERI